MNAYELADWLDEWANNYSKWSDEESCLKPVVNMLRDQANQIEKLQKENAEFRGHISTLFKEYKEYWEEHK